MVPLWASVIVGAMAVGMAGWGFFGFARGVSRLRAATTKDERLGARVYFAILTIRLFLVIVVIVMLAWTAWRS